MNECAHDPHRKPLDIKDDPLTGTVEIEGLRYSYELLKGLATDIQLNLPFVITKREDGVVTVEAYDETEIAAKTAREQVREHIVPELLLAIENNHKGIKTAIDNLRKQ